LVRRCDFLGCDGVIVRQAVFGGAGLLALLAADAQGRIVEDSLTHRCLQIAPAARPPKTRKCGASWGTPAQSDLGGYKRRQRDGADGRLWNFGNVPLQTGS